MSLNENKPTYGTAPVVEENSGTKGSRRGLVVGLVRPRVRGTFLPGGSYKPAPAVKPVAGVAGVPGLGDATPPTPPAKPATPETLGPIVQTGDKPITIGGPTHGVPHSHKTTPGGGVAAQGY